MSSKSGFSDLDVAPLSWGDLFMSTLFLIVGTAGIVGIISLVSMHFAKKRREALEAFYKGRGFSFDSGPISPGVFGAAGISPFNRSGGTFRNIGKMTTGNKTLFFADYSYTTGSGKNRKRHQQTVACMLGANTLPRFTLTREDIFSKIAQAVGYGDIDLPHDPEFSKKFVLRGEKPELIRNIFDSAVVNFIKKQPGIRLECEPNGVVWVVTGQMTEDVLASFITQSQQLFSLLKI